MRRQRACLRGALLAKWELSPFEMAQCCYLALMTDTGRFQFQNTTPEAFALAGEMVSAGARPEECSQRFISAAALPRLALKASCFRTCMLLRRASGRFRMRVSTISSAWAR